MPSTRGLPTGASLCALILLTGGLSQDASDVVARKVTLRQKLDQNAAISEQNSATVGKTTELYAESRASLRNGDREGVSQEARLKLMEQMTAASIERQKAQIALIRTDDERRSLEIEAWKLGLAIPRREAERPLGPLAPKVPVPPEVPPAASPAGGRGNVGISQSLLLLDDLKARAARARAGTMGSIERVRQFQDSVLDGASTLENTRIAQAREIEEQRRVNEARLKKLRAANVEPPKSQPKTNPTRTTTQPSAAIQIANTKWVSDENGSSFQFTSGTFIETTASGKRYPAVPWSRSGNTVTARYSSRLSQYAEYRRDYKFLFEADETTVTIRSGYFPSVDTPEADETFTLRRTRP